MAELLLLLLGLASLLPSLGCVIPAPRESGRLPLSPGSRPGSDSGAAQRPARQTRRRYGAVTHRFASRPAGAPRDLGLPQERAAVAWLADGVSERPERPLVAECAPRPSHAPSPPPPLHRRDRRRRSHPRPHPKTKENTARFVTADVTGQGVTGDDTFHGPRVHKVRRAGDDTGLTADGAGADFDTPLRTLPRSPTQPSPARPSPAKLGAAQPSPAQPDPARPSPAQPSLVQCGAAGVRTAFQQRLPVDGSDTQLRSVRRRASVRNCGCARLGWKARQACGGGGAPLLCSAGFSHRQPLSFSLHRREADPCRPLPAYIPFPGVGRSSRDGGSGGGGGSTCRINDDRAVCRLGVGWVRGG